MIINKINFLSFVNLNNIYTLIKAIKKLKLVRVQVLTNLNKLLYLKIEQKKNTDIYFKLSPIIIIATYLFKLFFLYKLVN